MRWRKLEDGEVLEDGLYVVQYGLEDNIFTVRIKGGMMARLPDIRATFYEITDGYFSKRQFYGPIPKPVDPKDLEES